MTFIEHTPEQAAELKKLQAELPLALKRAAEAMRTYGKPLEGKLLERFKTEEAKVTKIKRRIDELSGLRPLKAPPINSPH
jgi:hypothetical protein